HVGKALAHMGRLLDFNITVIDDRKEYANRENIPDADHLIVQDIGTAMSELSSGPDTYIVIVTRGHDHDAEALKPCIGSDSAYVGMIGSSHKVGIMKKRFMTEGWATPEQWSRIHTPIGLAIGSKSVQEIAVSIAAQLVSVRHLKNRNNAG
ncbi:MAG: XdhC family protein, partial [Bacteroidota bacterium]